MFGVRVEEHREIKGIRVASGTTASFKWRGSISGHVSGLMGTRVLRLYLRASWQESTWPVCAGAS